MKLPSPHKAFTYSITLITTYELITRLSYSSFYYSSESIPHPSPPPLLTILLCPHTLIPPEYIEGAIITQAILTLISPLHPALLLATWYLYNSLTLLNPSIFYILDRYINICLLLRLSPAVLPARMQILWIYLDASIGKLSDPDGGWTMSPSNGILPALDTYCRHTPVARLMYTALGPGGLGVLTPLVAYAELLAAPISVISGILNLPTLQYVSAIFLQLLHIGIGLTVVNSIELSLAACTLLFYLYPQPRANNKSTLTIIIWMYLLLTVIHEVDNLKTTTSCSPTSPGPVYLSNRWNVFTSSERYVTWELAIAKMDDGRTVNLWSDCLSGGDCTVSFDLPPPHPYISKSKRRGRYRSFPYLSGANWDSLCEPGVVSFEFYMLAADTLPDMGYGETRKRLINSHLCRGHERFEVELLDKEHVGGDAGEL